MPLTRDDNVHTATQPYHVHQHIALRGCAIPQVFIVAIAPACDPEAGDHGAGVPVARGEGNHPTQRCCTCCVRAHVHRCEALCRRATAQLPPSVASPALDSTACGQNAGMMPTVMAKALCEVSVTGEGLRGVIDR